MGKKQLGSIPSPALQRDASATKPLRARLARV
jgi:hypothetical protein